MKKFYVFLLLGSAFIMLQSGVNYSNVPPTGRTGATGNTCRSCHGTYALNSNGGVTVDSLPTNGYVAGTAYPFSLTITHGVADIERWGFSIKAVDATGSSVGSFSTTNGSAAPNGTELSHNNAPVTSPSASYTFDNLTWTAPASGVGDVRFYYAAIAGNNGNGDDNDYVYSGMTLFTLPMELKSFTAANDRNGVVLKWSTATESNSSYFTVERSDDGQYYESIGTVKANGNTTSLSAYSFADGKAASSGGNIFYHLKMVDKDGKTRYSNAVSIKPANSALFVKNIYPVLVKSGETVNIELTSDAAKNLEMCIVDASGKMYMKRSVSLMQGYNSLKVQTPAGIASGIVFLKLSADHFQQTESLIVR